MNCNSTWRIRIGIRIAAIIFTQSGYNKAVSATFRSSDLEQNVSVWLRWVSELSELKWNRMMSVNVIVVIVKIVIGWLEKEGSVSGVLYVNCAQIHRERLGEIERERERGRYKLCDEEMKWKVGESEWVRDRENMLLV